MAIPVKQNDLGAALTVQVITYPMFADIDKTRFHNMNHGDVKKRVWEEED